MQLRLVTVRLDPETGQFPEDPLAGIEGEVLNVVEHFFHHDGVPHLLLVVHHRADGREPATSSRHRREGATPGHDLDPGERLLFDKLRAWRRARAESDGVPVYVVMTNRHLAAVARAAPRSLQELQRIPGIGDGKAARYGRDVLEVVAAPAGAGDA